MHNYLRTATAAIAFVITLLLLAGCDNPVEDEHEEHAEVSALSLSVAGEEIVRVEEAQATGTISVPMGGSTDEIAITFLDDEGHEVHAEDLEEGYSLRWSVDDESVTTLDQTGTWSFVLNGLEEGETQLDLILDHGGHNEFIAPDIDVRVE